MVKSLAQPGPSNVTAADEPCRVDQDTLHDLDGPRHLQPKVSPDDMAFVGLTLSPRGGKDTGIDQDEAEATVEHEGQKLPLTVQQAVERDAAMEVMGGRGSAGEGVSGAMSSDPSTLTSEQDSRDFLAWMPGGSEALALIEDQVSSFHRSYVAVPGYHQHTSRKVAVWIATCKQGLQSTWLVQAAMGQRKGPFPFRKAGLAVESCVMAALHSTVFRSIKSWASQRDTQMSCAMRGLQEGGGNPLGRRLSQHSLRVCGVPEHLWAVDLGGVAERLSHLQHCRCPLEMMKCLQDANDAILIAVAGASGTGKGQLSADELLPMFIAALVAACPPHLPSTLEYLLSFHTEVRMGGHEAPVTTPAELLSCAGLQGDLQGKGGYLLAMLEASMEYLLQCQRKGLVQRMYMPHPEAFLAAPQTIESLDLATSVNSGSGNLSVPLEQLLSGRTRGTSLARASGWPTRCPSEVSGLGGAGCPPTSVHQREEAAVMRPEVDIRLPESSASEPPVSIVKKATSNSSPSREGEQKADVLRALQPKVPIPPFLTDWQGHRALRGTSPEAPARTPSSKGRYEGNSDSPSITGRAVDRSTELLSDRRNCLSLGSTPRRDYHPVRDSILVPAVGHLPAQVPLQEALRGAYNSRSSLRRLDFNALDAEDKEKRGPEDNSHGQGANLGGRESVMPGELQGQVARPPAVIPASDSGAKRNSLGSFLMELRQRQRL